MKNQMSRLVLVLAGVAVAAAISYALDADLRGVQSGELTLVCVMKDGDRVIAASRVTGFVDGVWLFDNGHARNCEVVKRGMYDNYSLKLEDCE